MAHIPIWFCLEFSAIFFLSYCYILWDYLEQLLLPSSLYSKVVCILTSFSHVCPPPLPHSSQVYLKHSRPLPSVPRACTSQLATLPAIIPTRAIITTAVAKLWAPGGTMQPRLCFLALLPPYLAWWDWRYLPTSQVSDSLRWWTNFITKPSTQKTLYYTYICLIPPGLLNIMSMF